MTALLLAPLVIFMAVVAPLWLILHYRSKNKIGSGISEQERQCLENLGNKAVDMQQRIDALEQILDESVTGWREKHV